MFSIRECFRRYSFLKTGTKDLLRLGFFAVFIIALAASGAGSVSYNWQWYRVTRYLFTVTDGRFYPGPLLDGLLVTLEISAASLFFSLCAGMAAALLRLSDSLIGRILSRVYLEAVRNTPLLIQLFFIYFVISPIFSISPFASAVLALSLFEGAYTSEIIRAGIMSVPRGQWEAAYSLGMKKSTVYIKVIFPQAAGQILPILASQSISLVKDSSLVSTIAIYDLTMRGQEIVADTFLTFEIWFAVALIYLLVAALLGALVSGIGRKTGRRKKGRDSGDAPRKGRERQKIS